MHVQTNYAPAAYRLPQVPVISAAVFNRHEIVTRPCSWSLPSLLSVVSIYFFVFMMIRVSVAIAEHLLKYDGEN